jgi:hypothetical protein
MISHRYLNLSSPSSDRLGCPLFVLHSSDSFEYVLGVDLANLLHRSTSNLYKSLRKSKVPIRPAGEAEIEYLILNKRILRRTTYSAMLVPLGDSLDLLLGKRESAAVYYLLSSPPVTPPCGDNAYNNNPFDCLLKAAAQEEETTCYYSSLPSPEFIFYAEDPSIPSEEDSSLEITCLPPPLSG